MDGVIGDNDVLMPEKLHKESNVLLSVDEGTVRSSSLVGVKKGIRPYKTSADRSANPGAGK